MDFYGTAMIDFCDNFELKVNDSGWLVGYFGALNALEIPHIITTKHGVDTLQIRDCPERVLPTIGRFLGSEQVAHLTQVHGPVVLEATQPGLAGQADGLFTRCKGLVLAGKSADCPIVLVADRGRAVIGFAHASWRSTVAGVVPALIRRMISSGVRPDSLVAGIGPSIGPECYEVGAEVRQAALEHIGKHAARFFEPGPAKDHFNLWRANRDALLRAGLLPQHIHIAGICTACHTDIFPCFRREKARAGRFVVAIGLT